MLYHKKVMSETDINLFIDMTTIMASVHFAGIIFENKF